MSHTSKKPSRAQIKELELLACSKTEVDPTYDLVVIGAGASGFSCSIEAARGGMKVLMLEANTKPAQKILATGNGRCNITNSHLNPAHFNNPEAVGKIFKENPEAEIREFFKSIGLVLVEETEGRMYPRSMSALCVKELLVQEAERLGVTIACGRKVTKISRNDTDNLYSVVYQENFSQAKARPKHVAANYVLLATGGDGLKEIQGLKLNKETSVPCLCALETSPHPHRILDGVRVQAQINAYEGDTLLASEIGEILFRSYGVSGICIFNLSRKVMPGAELHLDLFYDMSKEELAKHIAQAPSRHAALLGLLPPKLVEYLELIDHPLDKTPLCLSVKGPANIEAAQVTKGGLLLSQFKSETLESKLYPGVYAAGEVLDIDADCGGYNLSWAWISGIRTAHDMLEHNRK